MSNQNDFDQSLDGCSEFLSFKNNPSSLGMEQSLVGTSQKVYFNNASIINKQEKQQSTKFLETLNSKNKVEELSEEDSQENNQFLDVAKWKKNKPAGISNQMAKIQDQVEAKITQTQWKSQKKVDDFPEITASKWKKSQNNSMEQVKMEESSGSGGKSSKMRNYESSIRNEKSWGDKKEGKEDQKQQEQDEEQQDEEEQQQQQEEQQQDEQQEQDQEQEEQEEESSSEEQDEEDEEDEGEDQDLSESHGSIKHPSEEEITENYSQMKATDKTTKQQSKWSKKPKNSGIVRVESKQEPDEVTEDLLGEDPSSKEQWIEIQTVLLRMKKLVSK